MVMQTERERAQQAAFEELDATLVTPGTKGLPPQAGPIALGEIGKQGWNLLQGDLTTPVAVLSRSALETNSAFMRAFLGSGAAAIAPHGKTTLAPQIFAMQLRDGAWGLTISNVQHLAICRRFAFDRILIANELVGGAEIDYVFSTLAAAPELELYALIDSVAGVERLAAGATRHSSLARLNCLIEMGIEGGRAGCRSTEQALEVARAASTAGLTLRGVEGFEGILGDLDRVDRFLDLMTTTASRIDGEGLFARAQPIVMTAGGSHYYDRVVAKLSALEGSLPVQVIIRSGCYITHDDGMYAKGFAALRQRRSDLPEPSLVPALMVFASVQSRPEPGRAILSMGRRDAGTDAGLPVPLLTFRAGRDSAPIPAPKDWATSALNDQHTYLDCRPDADLAVGDLVGFGISHPCTTFDKWQVLFVIDDSYAVVDAYRTFF